MHRIIKIIVFAALLFCVPLSGFAQSQSLEKPKKEEPKATSAPKQKPDSKHAPKPKPKQKVKVEETADGERFTVNGVTFEMVRVEGGTFMMGAADSDPDALDREKPRHSERAGSFSIGRTEVTQALWKAVMGSNPSYFKGDNLPVEQVSWDDCQQFITKLNRLTGRRFRLPTEAEWEYAARGGNRSKGYKYSGSDDIGSVAWYDGNSRDKTHLVGQKLPNELGLYDMAGNVYELTSDLWCTDYSKPRSGSNRVFRGGSWLNVARDCRSANRSSFGASYRDNNLGFRLAL